MFGCSNTLGSGLLYSDTIGAQLEQIIGYPVINMGMKAGSIQSSIYNQATLAEHYMPKAVVNIWTSMYRITQWIKTNKAPLNLGPWLNVNDQAERLYTKMYEVWTLRDNPAQHATYLRTVSKALWQNTRYCECSLFADTAQHFGLPDIPTLDLALDNEHPGPKTALYTAEKLAENLKF